MPASNASAQLHASNLTVERGGSSVLDSVTLTISAGDRIGLVGPNGAGKSTLLQALAGELAPTVGSITTVPSGATVGLLRQELDIVEGETVAAHIARRIGVAAASDRLDRATDALAAASASDAGGGAVQQAVEEHQAALDAWMRLGGADLDARLDGALAAVALTTVGVDGPGPDRADRAGSPSADAGGTQGDHIVKDLPAAVLSGGQQARVGLAALMLARYDIVLLDEPTNDLDRGGLAQLEELVMSMAAPMIVVSHDRRFLERIVNAVLDIDPHDRSATLSRGSWSDYRHEREVARRHAADRYEAYRSERGRLEERARRQRQWAEKGLRAERTPPDNDRGLRGFRIEKTEKQASKARQTDRAIERLTEVDKPWEPWELRFSIGAVERSGDIVAELRDAEVALGRFRLGPLSLTVASGDRLAILGDNGHGKTTLLRALLGDLPLDRGERRLGPSVVVGRLDQARERLTTTGPFLDGFQVQTGLLAEEARSVLAKFGLGADHLARPSERWSPGERTRAVLAAFQATGVNTLVLDEPTNHLDLPAIEQLEGAIDRFEGTILLVTHDRSFLDGVRLTRTITVADGRLVADRPA